MEKRKWLWKKKSSLDKSPGESEASESMSSQSEKVSEEQDFTKGSPNHNIQSPEVTPKALSEEECNKENNSISKNSLLKKFSEANQEDSLENNLKLEPISDGPLNQEGHLDEVALTVSSNDKEESDSMKLLKEKLSAALINVSLKDELVKQHTKVAEDAVEGWEKAENEVVSLKEQLEIAAENNSALEARFSHLDQALKECVRQLRLAKDEQERKIKEAVDEKIKEFELSKSKLESQIVELQAQVEASSSISPEIHKKLEFLGRENERLNYELVAQSEELEIRTIERDLSTKAAETASKQHLESIRMVARLESECRKLKAISRKLPILDMGQKSPLASSYSIDSVTNNQSDGSEVNLRKMNAALMDELDQFKNEKSVGRNIDLMDDFLEMEKLVSMPENGHHNPKLESPQHQSKDEENLLKEELKVIKCRAAELEDKVQKLEDEKVELEMASSQSQVSLENLQVELMETKMKLEQLEEELLEANELKMDYESFANDLKLEAQAMVSKIEKLQEEIDRQRVSSEELSARCQELENDLHMKNEELSAAGCSSELEEKEKALEESRKRLEEVESQYKEAVMKFEKHEEASRSEVEEKEMALSESRKCLDELQIRIKEAELKLEMQNAVYKSEVKEMKTALAQSEERLYELQIKLTEADSEMEKLQKKLHEETESKERLLSEIANARREVETMSTQIDTLQAQIDKENGVSAELTAKCEELKKELKQKEQELKLECISNVPVVIEQKLNQEDLANAAGKLEECQKTIVSLGNQLKSLATLEDFLIDPSPLITNGGNEMWKLRSNNVYLPQKRCDDHFQDPEGGLHTFSKYVDGDVIESSLSSSTNMFSCSSSEKRGNGFEKLFPMRRG